MKKKKQKKVEQRLKRVKKVMDGDLGPFMEAYLREFGAVHA